MNSLGRHSSVLLEASRFRVERVTESSPDGSLTREIVRHPGAVTILPLVNEQQVCLIRNYRIAVAQTLIELPAGTLEAGEDPRKAAERELSEETGYRAGRIDLLATFYLSPGIMDEKMHLFVATGLISGEPRREPEEQIENYVVSWSEAAELMRTGEICDAKTLIGLTLGRVWSESGGKGPTG